MTSSDDAARILSRINEMPVTRWHHKLRVVVGMATLADGFDAVILSLVLPSLRVEWGLSVQQVGMIISLNFVGMAIGTVLFGWLAERLGRVRAIQVALALLVLFSIMSATSTSFETMSFYRLLLGVGIGGEAPVAAAYISEFSGAKGRGRFYMLYALSFMIGSVLASTIGAWVVPEYGWRPFCLISGTLPVIPLLLLFRSPESPRWLVSRGRLSEAGAVLDRIDGGKSPQLLGDPSRSPQMLAPITVPGGVVDLFTKGNYVRTLSVWVMAFVTYGIYYGVSIWLPTLLSSFYGMDIRKALLITIVSNCIVLFCNIACVYSIDGVGSRRWFRAAFALVALMLGLLSIASISYPIFVLLFLWPALGAVGTVGVVILLYTAEIYPTSIRTVGIGATALWMRISSVIAPLAISWCLSRGGTSAVFQLWTACAAVGAVASFAGMIDTKGKTLEELSPDGARATTNR